MKKFNKLFIILLCCIGAMSVTSCLNSDDGGGLSDEEKHQYTLDIVGLYNGGGGEYANKIVFTNDTLPEDTKNPLKLDTIVGGVRGAMYNTVTAAGKDSATFEINGVPGRLLAKELKDDKYKGLKKALEEAQSRPIRGTFYVQYLQYGTVLFNCITNDIKFSDLNYDGGTHDVTIKFCFPTIGSYEFVDLHKKVIIPLYIDKIDIDEGKETIQIYDTTSPDINKHYAAMLQIELNS